MSHWSPDELHERGDPESMRLVHILSCQPGLSLPHEQPITILHLGHNGQAEQPVALDLAETRRLLKGLLGSLGTLAPDDLETVGAWLAEVAEGDMEDEEEGEFAPGGRFAVPPVEEALLPHSSSSAPEAPAPPPAPEEVRRPRSRRPFGRALPDRPVKVRFEGETANRRFGFLGAFEMKDALLLVCRRWRPSDTGGRTSDDFLLKVPQPLPKDRRVVFCGRRLGGKRPEGLFISDVAWKRMDATRVGGRVVVNGVALVRIDIWLAWDVCRRRIFKAGCRWDEWA